MPLYIAITIGNGWARFVETPTTDTVPPGFTAMMASLMVWSWPTASITASAPRPPVASRIWAIAPPSAGSIVSAPMRSACSRRWATGSTASTRAGEYSSADRRAQIPTGPRPMTATVEPGAMSARRAPMKPVGRMSVSRTACSSPMDSGITRTDVSAAGTATSSAWPPASSKDVPNTFEPAFRQRMGQPARHSPHAPHPTTPLTSTRSPSATVRTSAPTSTTVPMNSWPRCTPACAMSPWYRCRSDPQIAVRSTRTTMPSGPLRAGSSTVSTETSWAPLRTTARMAGNLRQHRAVRS